MTRNSDRTHANGASPTEHDDSNVPSDGATGGTGSRRRYLALVAGSSLAAVSGCLSMSEMTPFTNDDDRSNRPNVADLDPETYQIDRTFREERSAAGTAIPELNETFDEWDAQSGSVSVDTDESARGDESLRLETDETTPQVIARYEFDDPMNFEDSAFSLAVKWDEPRDGLNQIALTLRDESGDSFELSQSVETFALNEWHRFDLGIYEIDGDPDLASIFTIEAWTWTEDVSSRVYIDDIRVTETASKSYVMIHFDDIFEGAYENAFPTLEEYGFRASGGTILDYIGKDGYMSREQLDELADHGWEFCNHPHADETFVEMDPDELESTLVEYKAWHDERGFEDGLDYIIYPYGEINDENLEVVSRYHKLGFKIPRSEYGANITSPLLCGRATGENLDEIQTAIDRAEAYNTVVPIMYHDVGRSDAWISKSEFDATMAYIDDADGVEVITTSEWLSMLSTGEFE